MNNVRASASDPATWQHMTTFTLGFGIDGLLKYAENYDSGLELDYSAILSGTKKWPDLDSGGEPVRSLDLWHAALNGRGRFYAVEKGEDLATAFRDIFKQINSATDPDLTSTATSGANSTRNDVGKFTGAYEPKNFWKGFVTAETVKSAGKSRS